VHASRGSRDVIAGLPPQDRAQRGAAPLQLAPASQRPFIVGGSVQTPSLAVSQPLSQSAIDARQSPAPAARPTIHVTIDRIEVRTPAVPSRAVQPTKARPASPSVPLADYLRGKVPS
jgi:hypothetical protein